MLDQQKITILYCRLSNDCLLYTSFLINLFHRMIVRKLPLFSAFQVADLSARAVQLVPRCIAAAVFGVPCVGGQKPFAADLAFFRCMTDT